MKIWSKSHLLPLDSKNINDWCALFRNIPIMQMSNYRQLLLLSSKVLSTYDPESNGVDTHLENFLQLPECSVSIHTHTHMSYVAGRLYTYTRKHYSTHTQKDRGSRGYRCTQIDLNPCR